MLHCLCPSNKGSNLTQSFADFLLTLVNLYYCAAGLVTQKTLNRKLLKGRRKKKCHLQQCNQHTTFSPPEKGQPLAEPLPSRQEVTRGGGGSRRPLLTQSKHCSTKFNIYFESLYVNNLRMRIQLILTANTYCSIQ